MGTDLADEFRSELVAAGGDLAAHEGGDLGERLVTLLARARAAHPNLDVTDDAFAAYLARAAARLPAGGPALVASQLDLSMSRLLK